MSNKLTRREFLYLGAGLARGRKAALDCSLNSGVRDAEMQNTEYADFNWEKCIRKTAGGRQKKAKLRLNRTRHRLHVCYASTATASVS